MGDVFVGICGKLKCLFGCQNNISIEKVSELHFQFRIIQ